MQRDQKKTVVRTASLADLPSILEIERACRTAAHWPEARYRHAIEQNSRLALVAEEADQVLGFVVTSLATHEWELENIAVLPKARRRGIGRALMISLFFHARHGGALEIWQEIRASNSAAQLLGQSVGFLQEGRRKDYYRDPREDALLLKYLVRCDDEAVDSRRS